MNGRIVERRKKGTLEMKRTVPSLFGIVALLLSLWAAPALGSHPATGVEALADLDLEVVEGGLTERQFGCGLAVAGLVVATATLGPGMLVAVGWSLSFHSALFACF
ncbi:MAG: hypothetical protein OXH70_08815 [Acidobacteria bacterium]|nr:hypothetical protein [Acidobacteriota bacterium]